MTSCPSIIECVLHNQALCGQSCTELVSTIFIPRRLTGLVSEVDVRNFESIKSGMCTVQDCQYCLFSYLSDECKKELYKGGFING